MIKSLFSNRGKGKIRSVYNATSQKRGTRVRAIARVMLMSSSTLLLYVKEAADLPPMN